jgi:hypothetical protein
MSEEREWNRGVREEIEEIKRRKGELSLEEKLEMGNVIEIMEEIARVCSEREDDEITRRMKEYIGRERKGIIKRRIEKVRRKAGEWRKYKVMAIMQVIEESIERERFM